MARDVEISRLLELMPPPPGAGEAGDWAAVESAWGFRFPSDYVEFVTRYGQGEIDRSLAVIAPDELMPPDAPQPGMRGMTEEARWLFEEDGEPTDEVRSAEQIIAWGGSCTGDTLGWLTVGDDPDEWPVLVLSRDGGAPRVFETGVVAFLHGVVSGEISPSPVGAVVTWGDRPPRFVHWRAG
ncbi:SMI1/KNR4 family protein [Kitasatospora sp. NPDC057015]|uniref:SMI1/KNR4 family protein n=1 Tax=Kitasatospora sp. NPDC057015 TaxID=3346001 RepID=UPI003634ADC1